MVIPPRFDAGYWREGFFEGLSLIWVNGRAGFINQRGEIFDPPRSLKYQVPEPRGKDAP
jgi:hypothetical protein